MNKNDFLKHRMIRFLQAKNIKIIAGEYLPVGSKYFSHPQLYKTRTTIMTELNNSHVVEENYDAILEKVNRWLS